MGEQVERLKNAVCYVCGERLMAGKLGEDIHYIKSRGETRWYCQKCMEKLLKGE